METTQTKVGWTLLLLGAPLLVLISARYFTLDPGRARPLSRHSNRAAEGRTPASGQ